MHICTITSEKYLGSAYVYILFSALTLLMIKNGLNKNTIFFEKFICIFLFLGFWLKLSIRVSFFDGQFNESVGGFDASPNAFDSALMVSCCGLSAIILANFIRKTFIFKYENNKSYGDKLKF